MRGIPGISEELDRRQAEFDRLVRTIPLVDMEPEDLWRFVRQRTLQLWIAEPPLRILFTEIVHHPVHSVLVLKYGAGTVLRRDIAALREVVFPWARSYGCTKVEVPGRAKWGKILGLTESIVVSRGAI